MLTLGPSCIRGLEHRFDIDSGWCWRCGKARGDGHTTGRAWKAEPTIDITQPRRGNDE